jgi:NADH-quinone oxidoreductase subunit F
MLELSGGVRAGHELKFWTPGGSSTPILTGEHLDTPLDYEGMASAGSMLGTKALQVFDDTVSVVRTTLRWVEFYKHESCGKCTPCREGSWWLVQLLRSFEAGAAEAGDVEKLLDLCDNIGGKSFCALADGFVACVTSAVKHFRPEFEAGYTTPAWELFPYGASALFEVREGSPA